MKLTCAFLFGMLALSSEVAPRRVLTGPPGAILGGPSPDGRFLSTVDPETTDLALVDLATGARRRLTQKPAGSPEFAYFSVVSRDARRVAYAWRNEAGFYDLRVVGVEGGEPRVLHRNEETGFVQPCAWTPDGSSILTLFFRKDNISQIAFVSAADGSVRVLKSLSWVYPKKMDLSPDGRFIVYDAFARSGGPERDLFVLAADGSREVPLVEQPGDDLFPVWEPGGRSVLFASDRSGAAELQRVGFDSARASGPPVRVRGDLGRFVPMGITAAGARFYGVRAGATDVYVATFDPAESRVVGGGVAVSGRIPGRSSAPAWSPDGRRLAYLSTRGSENFGQQARVVVIRSIETGEERDLSPKLAHVERVEWSPDGSALLAAGSDRRSIGGLYRIDAESGAVAPVVTDESATYRGLAGVWSADGRSVVYARGPEIRLHAPGETREAVLHREPSGADVRLMAADPSRRRLAFASARAISVMPIGGGGAREVLRLPDRDVTDLEWLRGRDALIAGDGGGEIWRIPLDGGAPVRAAAPAGWQSDLRVHPDGRRLAFSAGRTRSEVWMLERVGR